MKKLMLIFMFCMVMLFVGCGKQEAVESIVCDKDVSYEIAELESSQTHVSKPAGVCVFQNQVIVCDKEENKLSILDMDLNFVKEIKTFAPNEDELFVPTGMTVFEDKLYLLDSGNNRILILDSEFAIVEAIALKPIGIYQGDFRYTDVAVDKEGIIYVCSDNYMADDCVFVVENGEVKKTKQHFYGFLTEYKGEVYAVDSLELSEDGTSPKPGKNCVYRMNKTKMKKVKELPYQLSPTDAVFVKDKMVLLSFSESCFCRFSSGNYEAEQEFAFFEVGKINCGMYITALNETDFIATDSVLNNTIYYIHH